MKHKLFKLDTIIIILLILFCIIIALGVFIGKCHSNEERIIELEQRVYFLDTKVDDIYPNDDVLTPPIQNGKVEPAR